MMKLFDFAMAIERHDTKVILVDSKTRRIAFDGTAEELLDYSGIGYRKVAGVEVLPNPTGLKLEIK